jgi:acyl transferase domain-containing protein
MSIETSRTGFEIAVIGMSGAFPGATNINEFWQQILAGNRSVSVLSDEELTAAGVYPDLIAMENFVKAKGVFPDIEFFDASFFDYTPKDASVMDPQVRALHQCVFHALEDSGYISDEYKGTIGLFAGASGNFTWELETLLDSKESSSSQFETIQLNNKDFVATRIAYKLNLQGPCATVHTACSTSLYAIDMACRQLLTGSCTVAVAAASGFNLPFKNGYVHEEGMILSPDGVCRPFSDDANGTVEGNGMGAVVLKPLEDALEDRDRIYAVIRGTAANNDGNRKVGYTAPSVEGQAEVIRRALHMAEVPGDSISYIEAHGTGTNLGDPVEIEGLKKAFRSDKSHFCGIGSLKSNIGHLDTAAGVSSFIKTVKALQNKILPPSINFNQNNPNINFKQSPFYVVEEAAEWENPQIENSEKRYPRRAGVSSFGIGGTNVHLVLEEAPAAEVSDQGRDFKLLCLSAFDTSALERLENITHEYLLNNQTINPADFAYTHHVSKRNMDSRSAIVYQSLEELTEILAVNEEGKQRAGVKRYQTNSRKTKCAFLFSGQGTQYAGMGLGLYKTETVFRQALDQCMQFCDQYEQPKVRQCLMQLTADGENWINQTSVTQPALFSIEYAMATTLIHWGIKPESMIGHSLGEYVAACVSGVIGLEDSIKLVCARGHLMEAMPSGKMLAVATSLELVKPYIPDDIDIAGINGPNQITLSGNNESIEALAKLLTEKQIIAKVLHTSHAFHSSMMEPMLGDFGKVLAEINFSEPQIPYISNLTGDWITAEQAQSADYYLEHLRNHVNFSDGASQLLKDHSLVYVEIGPGNVLSAFIKQNAKDFSPTVVSSLRHVKNEIADEAYMLTALANLWGEGVLTDWKAYYADEMRNKVELPAYPFEKKAFPIGKGDIYTLLDSNDIAPENLKEIPSSIQAPAISTANSIYSFIWQNSILPSVQDAYSVKPCLAIIDNKWQAKAIAQVSGLRLTYVYNARQFKPLKYGDYKMSLDSALDYRRLTQALKSRDGLPELIIWSATRDDLHDFKKLADKLLKLSMILSAESPSKSFKCVVFLPEADLSKEQSNSLDSYIRAIRARSPHFNLRCVALNNTLDVDSNADIMEGELYDTEQQQLLTSYPEKRRQVYQLSAVDTQAQRTPNLTNKKIGLLLPSQHQAKQWVDVLTQITGADITPLSYKQKSLVETPDLSPIGNLSINDLIESDNASMLEANGLEDFTNSHALMNEACCSLVLDYVQSSMTFTEGTVFTREQMVESLAIVDRLQKYADYFIHMFLQDGFIRKLSDEVAADNPIEYQVLETIRDARGFADIKSQLAQKNALFVGNLKILEHCVSAFPKALNEDIPPISVLYPDGTNTLLEESYTGSLQELEETIIQQAYGRFLEKILPSLKHKTIRILEAGGGFGLTMRHIAPLLKGYKVEYYFTDIGKTFLYEAKRYALENNYDFFSFGLFDMTKSADEQGLALESFDLAFATNAVHATTSVKETLSNIRPLIKKGGLMCLIERTTISRYLDLIWGLADGWWHFDNNERSLSPLMPVENWSQQLLSVGFEKVCHYPQSKELQNRLELSLIVAQMPTENTNKEGAQIKDSSAPYIDDYKDEERLDGLIVIDELLQEPKALFEVFGDDMVRPELDQSEFLQQLINTVEKFKPGFVSLWSDVTGLNYGNNQLHKASLDLNFEKRARSLLGNSGWSKIYLPLDKNNEAPSNSLVRNAFNALQGNLDKAVLLPQSPGLFGTFVTMNADSQRVERSALNVIQPAQVEKTQDFSTMLSSIWSDLFGMEHIGLDDDFFELGGDSLKVAQLTAEIETHGIKLLANEVFNQPTIRSLADYLRVNHSGESSRIKTHADFEDYIEQEYGYQSKSLTIDFEDNQYQFCFLPDDLFEANQETAEEVIQSIKLPETIEPHYVLPLSLHEHVKASSQADLWGNIGLKSEYLDETSASETDEFMSIVNQGMHKLNQVICATPVSARYPLSPFQKIFMNEETRFAFYLIDFDERVDRSMLDKALSDIVSLQGLMRSELKRNWHGRLVWDEYEPSKEILQIPEIDLSGYSPSTQTAVIDKLMEKENQSSLGATGVMFRVMLVRFDRRRHTLLFNLDHSIFDNMSGQVLRRQLLNRYRELVAGNRAQMGYIKSFHHYLKQLNRGPQGISKQKLIELFELKEYEKSKISVENLIAERRQPSVKSMRYELDLQQFQLSDDDNTTWELTVTILSCVLGRFLNQEKVPLKLIYQGRQYQDLSYFDTLGLFIDILPLLVTVDRENPASMIESIARKVRFVNRYNVSFMNMLLNLKMRFKWWDVLAPLNPKKLEQRDPMILLNYVGKAEDEYQKIIDFASKQMEKSENKLGYASFYVIVTEANGKVIFDVFCNFEENMQNLHKIFVEEADYLFGSKSSANADKPNALDHSEVALESSKANLAVMEEH